MLTRHSGILMPVSALPSPYGIGDLGPEARKFVDSLSAARQSLWQVLPLGPTGYGDSPYQSFSTFAGNELLISPEDLAAEGWLDPADLAARPDFPAERVDYGWVIYWKKPLLRKAARTFIERAPAAEQAKFTQFKKAEKAWLATYALFMSIKEFHDAKAQAEGVSGGMWATYWPRELALGEAKALSAWSRDHAADIAERQALQFLFFKQLAGLRERAKTAGVRIIGDLPIFVAYDSVDVWARRDLFQLDKDGKPTAVAGVPPDYFSADGQLWGNPLYAWEKHRKSGYSWWITRLKAALRMYDLVRIDHFRGFEAYWSVPYGEKTAVNGAWKKGPDHDLFKALKKSLGPDMPVIAEDLGLITPEVHALRDDFGLPGMRVLQFAFEPAADGKGINGTNTFLPHNYEPNAIVYTGTHDNDTLRGWLGERLNPELKKLVFEYVGCTENTAREALIKEALKSVARYAVIPLQDLLWLGNEARMNAPATTGAHNWSWRMRQGAFTHELQAWLATTGREYNRNA
jgi:4-alpha-glucanotransferase